MKHQWGLKMGTRSVWEGDSLERRWTVTEVRGKNWKRFKNCSYFCQTRVFRDLSESPQSRQFKSPKTLKDKNLKNFSKCFSRLEGLPARQSPGVPRKSLCTLRDWTFHSRTSRQNRPASSRLWHAIWMNRDWVTKIGQHCFWNFQFL